MKEKVSVVVPIYKMEKYLRQCLDSIVGQSYRRLEIILVDDGSPDNCGAICEEYAAKDDRIIVLHKQNGGLAAAKNDGLKMATGEWITFIDADDWIETDLFEKMMEAVGEDAPDIMIEGGYYYAYPQKRIAERTVPERFLYREKKDIYKIMARIRCFGLPWDKFYRVDFLRENKLLNDVDCRAFEDYFFNIQALDQARTVLGVPYCGYYYRQEAGGNQFTRGFNPKKPQACYDFLCKLNSYIIEHGLEAEMTATAMALAIQAFNVALSCYAMNPDYDKGSRERNKEINAMKQLPYYHEAIWCHGNKIMTPKQRILQYALRLPGVLPTKLAYHANQWLRQLQTR